MPQPLNTISKTATNIRFAVPRKCPIRNRPDLLPLVMQVITEWTTLESIVNGTIVAILAAGGRPRASDRSHWDFTPSD